jgi:hypothetical protein
MAAASARVAAAASRVKHGLPCQAAERIRGRLYLIQREIIELPAELIAMAFISPPIEAGVFC